MKSSIRKQITPDLQQAIAKASGKVVADRIGATAIARILDRTKKGKFLGGKYANKPYSKGYAKLRLDSGRKASPVTLLFTGAMLNSLNSFVKEHKNRTVISIRTSPREMTKAYYTNNQREWLALSDKETDALIKFIEQEYKLD